MTRYVCHSRKGAVRGEYIIAAAICTVLLIGMTAVLIVQGSRINAPRARIATPQNRPENSVPEPSPQVRPQPQAQPNVQKNANTQAPQNNDATPIIIVTEEPTQPTTPGGPPAAGKSTAYPNGEPRLVSANDKTRIEVKDYDKGGEGVAYHDATPQNEGRMYRADEGVDLEKSNDSEGEYNVGFVQSGEWINYSIRVAQSGEYKLRLRIARQDAGEAKLRILFDGSDKTGEIAIPATGGYTQYKTIDAGQVELAAGLQVMRLDFVAGGFNLEWVELVPAAAAGAPTETVQIEIPAGGNSPEVVVIPGAGAGAANVLLQDAFADVKVGARPATDGWTYSTGGTVTVQQDAKSTEHFLRIVDQSNKADAWVRRAFPAQKDKVIFTARMVASVPRARAGISLVEKDKPAVLLVMQGGQLGYVKDDGKWNPLMKPEVTAWMNVRIEASLKDRKFSLFINDKQVGDAQMPFRNYVGEIDGWMCGTAVPQTGTIYIQSVSVAD